MAPRSKKPRNRLPPRPPVPEAWSTNSRGLSDFEYGLIIASHAFMKWVIRCMAAAGISGLGALDVLLLHAVNHRARGRKLADICLVLNVEDRHVVSYALKKLLQHGLVEATRKGHETRYVTTPKGDEACLRYRRVREACVVRSLTWLEESERTIGAAASFLRTMTALYGQAERLATIGEAPPPGNPSRVSP